MDFCSPLVDINLLSCLLSQLLTDKFLGWYFSSCLKFWGLFSIKTLFSPVPSYFNLVFSFWFSNIFSVGIEASVLLGCYPIHLDAPSNSASIAGSVSPSLTPAIVCVLHCSNCPAWLYYWIEIWGLSPKSWINIRGMKMIKKILETVINSKDNNWHSSLSGVPRYICINIARLLCIASVILRKIWHRCCHIVGFLFREYVQRIGFTYLWTEFSTQNWICIMMP